MFAPEAHQEDLLLALLNSAPVVDGVRRDALADRAGRESWLRARGVNTSRADAADLVRGRDALQGVVRGTQSPKTLASHLEPLAYTVKMTDDGVEWVLDGGSPRSLMATAVLTWDATQRTKPGRLRACANPECELFLIDRSKANSARWCSMAVCGNRMKARRHYERSRAEQG